MATQQAINDVQEELDLQLVACVEARPVLWDHKHAFEEKSGRLDAWKEILPVVQGELMPDAASVEKRWKLLRDRYARERKKMLLTDPPAEPKWYCWPSLAFLKHAVRSRKRRSMAQVAALKTGVAAAAAELTHQGTRQHTLGTRQAPTMKYFQVSFPEGGSQMKADLVSMEPADASVSPNKAMKRTKLDLCLPRHQLSAGRQTRHSVAAAAAVANPTTAASSTSSGAVVAADDDDSAAALQPPAKISCLTSRLDTATAAAAAAMSSSSASADGLPSPMLLTQSDDIIAASSVPTSYPTMPSPSRIHHSTSSVVGSSSSTTAALQLEAGNKGQGRSAFALPLDTTARPRAAKPSAASFGAQNHIEEPPAAALASLVAGPQVSYAGGGGGQGAGGGGGGGGGAMDGLDAETLFGAHVAATLRTLPRRHRARLQLSIEQCIVDMLSGAED